MRAVVAEADKGEGAPTNSIGSFACASSMRDDNSLHNV
jgi:hypothetical protein